MTKANFAQYTTKTHVSTVGAAINTSVNKPKDYKNKSIAFNKMADMLNASDFHGVHPPLSCDFKIDVEYNYCGIPTDYVDGNGIVPECLAKLHLIHVDKDGIESTVYSSYHTSAIAVEGYDRMASILMYQAIFWVGDMSAEQRTKIIEAVRKIQHVLYIWKGYWNPTENPVYEGENHSAYFSYTDSAFDYNEIKRSTYYAMTLVQANQKDMYEFEHHGYTVQLKRSLVREIPPGGHSIDLTHVNGQRRGELNVMSAHTKQYYISSRWTFLAKDEHDGFNTEEKYLISEKTPIDVKPMSAADVLAKFDELYLN